MDFNSTQEQIQLADSLRRWAEKNYNFDQRNQIVHSTSGVSEKAWKALADLGLMALRVPAPHGGFDGDVMDMYFVLEELGRSLFVEPYVSTMIAAEFIKHSEIHGPLLEKVATGAIKLSCAIHEKDSRFDLFHVATSAVENNNGYLLNGKKTIVSHGAQADYFIVSARTAGCVTDLDGILIFLIPTNTPGLEVQDYRTIDGHRAADVSISNVQVPRSSLVSDEENGWDLLESTTDYGIVLLCAEAVGAMESLNAATLDYLKTRRQFGTLIGNFQVLQHRMVDMTIHFEQARALTLLAAERLSKPITPNNRRQFTSAAKARIGQAIRFITQQSIQLHGGMGLTAELPLSHYVKRLTIIDHTLGDVDHHLARFVAQPEFSADGVTP